MTTPPVRVALVNDYEIVLAGLRSMLAPFSERIHVVELNANTDVVSDVDIALYDTYGQDQGALESVRQVLGATQVRHVVLYSWSTTQHMITSAVQSGIDGVLSKSLAAEELASSLALIADGHKIFSSTGEEPERTESAVRRRSGTDWPGRSEGLTMREAEMITLIAMGLSNAEIANRTYLSPNSVKSYIRSAYRKIGVARRSQAVAWGLDHNMVPDRSRQIL